MGCLEIGERHKSLEDISQPLPFPLGMRRGPYMGHFTSLLKEHGKDCIFVHNDPLTECLYSFSIDVQFISLKGGTLLFRLHDLLGATISDGDGYSLGYFGEMISYSGCTQLAPHIIHLIQECERIGVARKWFGNHSSYHILRQSRVIL